MPDLAHPCTALAAYPAEVGVVVRQKPVADIYRRGLM
jgi:hypothetical protein